MEFILIPFRCASSLAFFGQTFSSSIFSTSSRRRTHFFPLSHTHQLSRPLFITVLPTRSSMHSRPAQASLRPSSGLQCALIESSCRWCISLVALWFITCQLLEFPLSGRGASWFSPLCLALAGLEVSADAKTSVHVCMCFYVLP